MAKKKKTMVMMPGAMSDLAHSVQRGTQAELAKENEGEQPIDTPTDTPVVDTTEASETPIPTTENAVAEPLTVKPQPTEPTAPAPQPAPEAPHAPMGQRHKQAPKPDTKDRTAPAAKKLPKAEGAQLAREYSLAKSSGEDSWDIFLDLARDYKARDSRLATVYIDSDLKGVLDRLKSATSVKLPTTALLSAIVARFVFDHESDIKNAIFGESLL